MRRDVLLEKLAPWNPLEHGCWAGVLDVPISKQEIADFLASDKPRKTDPIVHNWSKPASREEHLARIAYLVESQSMDPIEIDVGVPELGCYVGWIVLDGNHRLAAAFYRGDKHIKCDLSGSEREMEEVLGIQL